MTALVAVIGIIAVLAVIGFGLSVLKKIDAVSTVGPRTKIFSENESGKQIQAALTAMWNGSDHDAERALHLVDALRADAASTVAEMHRAYDVMPVDNYNVRWALVNLATILEHTEALSFLDRVIKGPVPQERSRDMHRFPTVTCELMIRVQGIEGLRRLAKADHDVARALLLGHLSSSHFSIRKSAALALLGLPDGSQYRSRIMDLLQKHEHFVLDIREPSVEDAGRVNYSTGARARAVSPAPMLSSKSETHKERPSRRRGPPTI